ncbi:uracil-DNA glycosylase [Sphingopyxis sp. NJF-3]
MANLEPSPGAIVERLAQLKFDNVFNPYADICEVYDGDGATSIRQANLRMTLEAASKGTAELWLALEPGHRGARRTGLAMTDDRRLQMHADHWGIEGIQRATSSGPETEATAGIVWSAVTMKDGPIFLWNVFPLHSHRPGNALSNRRHTRSERGACNDVTLAIFELLEPDRVFAIGKDAYLATEELGIEAVRVRHPSFGGKMEFLKGIGLT